MDDQPENRILQSQTWQPLHERSGSRRYGVDRNRFDRVAWFDPDDPRQGLLIVGNSFSKDLYNVLINSDSATEHFQIARFGTQVYAHYSLKGAKFFGRRMDETCWLAPLLR